MNPRKGNSPAYVFGLFILLCSIGTSSDAAETVLKTQNFALYHPNNTMVLQFQVPGPGKVILEATTTYPLDRLGLFAQQAYSNATNIRKDGPTPLRLEFTVTAQDLAKASTWTVYTTLVGPDGTVYAIPGRAATGGLKVSFVSNVSNMPVPMQKTALPTKEVVSRGGIPAVPAGSVPIKAAPEGTLQAPTAVTLAPKAAQPPRLATPPAGSMTPTAAIVEPSVPQPPGSKTQKQITVAPTAPPILIGTGISDITGPIAEVRMMGYANIDQVASGLHMRLYARAFVFANPNSGRRVVMVTAELGQIFSSLKQGVIRRLQQIYGPKYDDGNVMISATHTHAGPGGYSHHAIFNITCLGFIQQNYDAIVDGITKAIVQADGNVAPATLRVATGYMMVPDTIRVATGNMLASGSVNRSRFAHQLNRDLTSGMSDVNREMLVLRVDRPTTGPAGVIAWFPVHNTSMSRDNLLVSSDHKGYAAYLFEKEKGTVMPLKQPGKFVAAFPNGDEGDVSPNIWPNFTRDGGEFGAMHTIGQLEFENANKLFNYANETVTGPLEYRHMFVRMSGLDVPNSTFLNGANQKKLCKAAYGLSFGGGAEDGPSGVKQFREGMTYTQTTAEELANLRSLFSNPLLFPAPLRPVLQATANDLDDPCQRPKPVLLPTGAWQWTPDILPFQLLRVGTLAIAAVPSEMTTQAGRRLRNQLLTTLRPHGVTYVVITGLANEYSGYVSTPEEYSVQHYEGASTLYGPLTLDAYLQVFGQLANAMAGNQSVPAGPAPLNLSANQVSLQTGVLYDDKRLGEQFGQALQQPNAAVARGGTVQATFRAGHPKNDLRTNNTYLWVERKDGANWVPVAWDSMPETRLTWRRDKAADCLACSFADVRWDVPPDAVVGTYRIRHAGAWKNGKSGAISQYAGVTNNFQIGSTAAASPPPVEPCGGTGQRACCVTERIPSCNEGLIEYAGCTTGNCTCGGANPGGTAKSIGYCAAPPPPPPVASCGGAGQRACCVTERVPSCNKGLIEMSGCTTGDCTCGGINPIGNLKSIGHCVASQ
jgi:neutral ceramidase